MGSGLIGTVEFEVMIHEAGPDKKARLKTLFNYMQAAADAHSRTQGTSLGDFESSNLSWVYSRFYADVMRYPFLYEKLTCSTWRSKIEKQLAFREFSIKDSQGKVLVAATSTLALINRDTRKPVDLDSSSGIFFKTVPERAVDYTFNRIPVKDVPEFTYRSGARYEDIDVNNHMNNSSYAQNVYESLLGRIPETELASIDIAFRGEVSFRDELVCFSAAGEDGAYYHRMLYETKNSVSALAVTVWR